MSRVSNALTNHAFSSFAADIRQIQPFGRLTKFGLEELIFQEPPLPVVLACYGCKATDAQLFLEDGRALCAACRVLHHRIISRSHIRNVTARQDL